MCVASSYSIAELKEVQSMAFAKKEKRAREAEETVEGDSAKACGSTYHEHRLDEDDVVP